MIRRTIAAIVLLIVVGHFLRPGRPATASATAPAPKPVPVLAMPPPPDNRAPDVADEVEVEPYVVHAVRPVAVPWHSDAGFSRPDPAEYLQALALRGDFSVRDIDLLADVDLEVPRWDHPWRRPNHLPTERDRFGRGPRPVPDTASTLGLLAGALAVIAAAARAHRGRSERARQM